MTKKSEIFLVEESEEGAVIVNATVVSQGMQECFSTLQQLSEIVLQSQEGGTKFKLK